MSIESNSPAGSAKAVGKPAKDPVPRIALSIEETTQAIGCSRAHVYRLASQGLLEKRSIGRRAVITMRSITALIEGEAA